jgi:hypothetical protein
MRSETGPIAGPPLQSTGFNLTCPDFGGKSLRDFIKIFDSQTRPLNRGNRGKGFTPIDGRRSRWLYV